MQTADGLRAMLETGLASIKYPSRPEGLFRPIVYALESGGKRIRPFLVLAVYDWITHGREDLSRILPAALAIEVFHNFTLLHDDIMDRSALRRGRPTVCAKWDDNTAILSGDAMSILAYELLAQCPQEWLPGLLARFNRLAMAVCLGQQWDMEFEALASIRLEEYLEMVEHKTAALIEGSVRMGAHAAAATPELEEALAGFAREFGIAFQLQDDLLDVYGDTATFGKECGDDIVDNKKTYLSVLAQLQASDAQRETMRKSIAADLSRQEKVDQVKAVYATLGIEAQAREAIEGHFHASVRHLERAESLVQGEASLLRDLLDSLAQRVF